MKLGLNFVRVAPSDMPALAAHAEGLGFESVFVPDHVVFPVHFDSRYPGTADGRFPYPRETPLYDPLVLLALIGQATSSIRLGTAVYLAALRHPIAIARQLATVEHVVGHRVLFGVGAGWLTEEFDALGISPRSRFSRMEEVIDALRRLWRDPEPSFAGKHFAFGPVHFTPKPPSDRLPPILVGGDSDAALRRALLWGDGWMSGGTAANVEEVAVSLERLAALRREHAPAHTDGAPAGERFSITILWPNPSAEELDGLARIGVDRVVIMPWRRNREASDAIQRYVEMACDVVALEGPGDDRTAS